MCYVDLEPASAFVETPVKHARRERRCDCCGGVIGIGNSYTRHFSVMDGRVTIEAKCATCTELVAEFREEHGQYANPSSMVELIEQCADDGDESSDKWKAALLTMRQRGNKR